MVLDARLKKLAPGLSARQAALAYARKRGGESSLTDAEAIQAEEFEATIEAMFLMAAVDGDIGDEEVAQLAASLQAIMDLTASGREMDLDKTLAELNAKLDRDGWKTRLDTLAARLPGHESRAFAFRLAAGVAFVDDHVAHAEAAAIDALAAALALSTEDSQQILIEVQQTLFVT